MGTEILVIFIAVPIVLLALDFAFLIQKRNVIKRIVLISIGMVALGFMALLSSLSGFHPAQGLIVGSIYYLPIYGVVWLVLTVIESVLLRMRGKEQPAKGSFKLTITSFLILIITGGTLYLQFVRESPYDIPLCLTSEAIDEQFSEFYTDVLSFVISRGNTNNRPIVLIESDEVVLHEKYLQAIKPVVFVASDWIDIPEVMMQVNFSSRYRANDITNELVKLRESYIERGRERYRKSKESGRFMPESYYVKGELDHYQRIISDYEDKPLEVEFRLQPDDGPYPVVIYTSERLKSYRSKYFYIDGTSHGWSSGMRRGGAAKRSTTFGFDISLLEYEKYLIAENHLNKITITFNYEPLINSIPGCSEHA